MSDEAYLKSEVPDIDESRVKIEALRAEEERLKANRFKDADGSKAYNKARSTREALESRVKKIEATTIRKYHESNEYREAQHANEKAAIGSENRSKNLSKDDKYKRWLFVESNEYESNGTFLDNEGDKARIMALKARVARFHEFSARYGRDGLLTLAGGDEELNKLLRGGSFQEHIDDVDNKLNEIFKKKNLYPELMKNVKMLDERLLPASIMTQIDDILDGKKKLIRQDEATQKKAKATSPKTNSASKALKAVGKALPFAIIAGAAVANENQGAELSGKDGTPVKAESLSNRRGTVPTVKPANGAH